MAVTKKRRRKKRPSPKSSRPKIGKVGKLGKLDKSAWILSQSHALSAKQLVAQAQTEGIRLTVAQVHAARTSGKSRPGRARPGSAPPRASKPASVPKQEDLRREFVRITMRIGTEEAQRLLDRIIDVQTPIR